jgi:hypothetical protein
MEVMGWLALKRLQKKQAFLPPPFHEHSVGYIMSISKLAKRLLLLPKS